MGSDCPFVPPDCRFSACCAILSDGLAASRVSRSDGFLEPDSVIYAAQKNQQARRRDKGGSAGSEQQAASGGLPSLGTPFLTVLYTSYFAGAHKGESNTPWQH